MRTIGKKNVGIVKKMTLKVMAENKEKFMGTGVEQIIDLLPSEMWDTWESADSEIRRIINDTIWSRN